nr:MAG: capsid protein [Cressdnaviricota sp.]
MKYGRKKFKKKHFRKSYHKRNSYASRKSSRKNFERQLNSVAEKKTLYFANPLGGSNQATTLSTDNTVLTAVGFGLYGFMYLNLVQGTSRSQRVGTKIFIRKIVVKGEIYNQQGVNFATSIVGVWGFREKTVGSMAAYTRNSLIGSLPFTLIPDLGIVPYKLVCKRSSLIQGFNSGALNNTLPTQGKNGMGYLWHYKIKFNVFKSMVFETTTFKMSDGLGDLFIIPWIDSGLYNSVGLGIQNTSNVRVTYTDV